MRNVFLPFMCVLITSSWSIAQNVTNEVPETEHQEEVMDAYSWDSNQERVIEKKYAFDGVMEAVTTYLDAKNRTELGVINNRFFLSRDDSCFAVRMTENGSSSEVTIIMDFAHRVMIFMDQIRDKQIMHCSEMAEALFETRSESEPPVEHSHPTGRKKMILNYPCEEWESVSDSPKFSIWISEEPIFPLGPLASYSLFLSGLPYFEFGTIGSDGKIIFSFNTTSSEGVHCIIEVTDLRLEEKVNISTEGV